VRYVIYIYIYMTYIYVVRRQRVNIAWFYRNVPNAVLLELFKDKGLFKPLLERIYFKTSTINRTANTDTEFISCVSMEFA
jgi:hypothetical protein